MPTSPDQVSSFLLTLHAEGCQRQRRYDWRQDKAIALPAAAWQPVLPKTAPDLAVLQTAYANGRVLEVEIDGAELEALEISGRLDKLLDKIGHGHTPGEALKRQLARVMGLPRLPKLKKSQQRQPKP